MNHSDASQPEAMRSHEAHALVRAQPTAEKTTFADVDDAIEHVISSQLDPAAAAKARCGKGTIAPGEPAASTTKRRAVHDARAARAGSATLVARAPRSVMPADLTCLAI
jgi:hypothetical protein